MRDLIRSTNPRRQRIAGFSRWMALTAMLVASATFWVIWRDGHWSRWTGETAATSTATRPTALTNTVPRVMATNAPVPMQLSRANLITVSNPSITERRIVLTNRVATNETVSVPSADALRNLVMEAQIALDQLAISPGSIDGVMGSQTRAALRAFQTREGLPVSGQLDTNTVARLLGEGSFLTTTYLGTDDLTDLAPVPASWLGKSEQLRLSYENALELVAERSHSHPHLIRRLNPRTDWTQLTPGMEIFSPRVDREKPSTRAAYVRIQLAARILQAYDGYDRLLAHFPCSIAQRIEKRPLGELRVAVVVPNPDYTFDPAIFPESTEARELGRKLRLPPGPNNPVGTAWIGLDRPGYGIHGTPKPEDVGRTESHGCFRLANWNANYLLSLVTVGTPVIVEP